MQDKEFAAILQDEPMQPLALVPLTEEEQVRGEHTLRGNQDTDARGFMKPHAGQDLSSKTRSVGSQKAFLTFLTFCSLHSLPLLSTEEFLHVCEQCGCAEAHGKRGGRGCASRGGQRKRGHTRRSR